MKLGLKWLVLALLLMTLVAFTGCSGEEQKAVLQQVDVLESADGATIARAVAPVSKETYGEETIVKRTDDIYAMLKITGLDYKNLRFDRDASNPHKRVYQGTMAFESDYGSYETPQTLTFIRDAQTQQWLLEWSPASVFPGLTTENDMVVETIPAKRGTIFDRNGLVMAQDNDGKRTYPYGQTAASLIGFVRSATMEEIGSEQVPRVAPGTPVGREGLEAAYNEKLQASYGVRIALSDNDTVLFESPAQDGSDIHTTIDMTVQEAAYNTINGEWGSAVAIHPTTGQVLALVSVPDYNPVNWMDDAMSSEDFQATRNAGSAPNGGIYTQKYTPGSTQKLFTTLIGFKTGILTPQSTYEIYGSRWQPDNSWGGYTVHRVIPYNGVVDLENALVLSDNIFFARAGMAIGADAFNEGMKNLGVGEEVPCPLPIQKSQISESNDLHRDVALADSAYGQYQVQITPMQMAMTYTLLQNNGTIMKPRLLTEEAAEPWITETATAEQLSFLNRAFRDVVVVSHPTANRSYAAFSGKTGTAEVGPGGKTNLGWFAGYDQNNPNITLCVMINHVEKRGGSDVPCMYFGRIMDALYADGVYAPDALAQSESLSEENTAA